MSPTYKSKLDFFVKTHLKELTHIAHSSIAVWGETRPTSTYKFKIVLLSYPENFIVLDLYDHSDSENIFVGFPISHDAQTIRRENISSGNPEGFICDGCEKHGSMGFTHCLKCNYDLCEECEGGFDHRHSSWLKNIGCVGFNTYEKKHILDTIPVSIPAR